MFHYNCWWWQYLSLLLCFLTDWWVGLHLQCYNYAIAMPLLCRLVDMHWNCYCWSLPCQYFTQPCLHCLKHWSNGVRVCVCMYMHACVCTCVCVCMCVCTCMRACACMRVYVHACVCACVCVCVHACVYVHSYALSHIHVQLKALYYGTSDYCYISLSSSAGTHLLPYSTVINQLFVHTLTWTSHSTSYQLVNPLLEQSDCHLHLQGSAL